VCVCVCVSERERETDRQTDRDKTKRKLSASTNMAVKSNRHIYHRQTCLAYFFVSFLALTSAYLLIVEVEVIISHDHTQ
jgi:hypothetical protein